MIFAGDISFDGENVGLEKIAGAVRLNFRYRITLNPHLRVLLSDINGDVEFAGQQRSNTLILGTAFDPKCYVIDTDYKFPSAPPQRLIAGVLRLILTPPALEMLERYRAGSRPEFRMTFRSSALVRDSNGAEFHLCTVDMEDKITIRTDRDSWIKQLSLVSPLGGIVVEVPLPTETSGSPLAEVWREIQIASASLSRGGESGWRNCVVEVRRAIEVWREVDPAYTKRETLRKERNKKERLFDNADALYHFCSLSAHVAEHVETWTRSDAIFALSTLCTLLSARNL